MNWDRLIGLASGVLLCAGLGVCGPDWEEPTGDDAGDSTLTSQVPKGSGQLNSLTGKLDGGNLQAFNGPAAPDFQDLYLVRVVSPTTFHIATTSVGGGSGTASFDTELFVFRADGSGLLANDNESAGMTGSLITPVATDGSGFSLTVPGLYYIGISGFDSEPLAGMQPALPIFDLALPTEISGADGAGGSLGRIVGWSAGGGVGTYVIDIAGCTFVWGCDADANGDDTVDVNDISYVLFRLGDVDEPGADVNQDGVVDVNDISYVLFRLGDCPT